MAGERGLSHSRSLSLKHTHTGSGAFFFLGRGGGRGRFLAAEVDLSSIPLLAHLDALLCVHVCVWVCCPLYTSDAADDLTRLKLRWLMTLYKKKEELSLNQLCSRYRYVIPLLTVACGQMAMRRGAEMVLAIGG